MDTLHAVRTHKSAFATAVSQAPEGSTTTEVRQLRMQLKARELEDARMRSDVKELKDTVVQLQAEFKTQQVATSRPSAEDLDRRLVVLEVARQAADTWQSKHAKEFSNLSAQQQILHTRIEETKRTCTETNGKATSLDKDIKDINQDLRGLHQTFCKDITDYIGPVRQAYFAAKELTVLQRVAKLEHESMTLSKEQAHLSSQMESVSSRPFVKQEEFEALKGAVGILEEDKQDIDTKITHLSNAHDQLSTSLKEHTKDKTASTMDADDNHAVADLSPSKESFLALERRTTDLAKELKKLQTKVEVNENGFFEIFGEIFDPLKASLEDHIEVNEKKLQSIHQGLQLKEDKTAIEEELRSIKERLQLTEEEKSAIDEKLQTINERLYSTEEDTTAVEEKLQSCDRTLTELSKSVAEQLQESERKLLQQVDEVKQDLTRLQDSLTNVITETAQFKTATGNLEQALASKQDTAETLKLIEAVKLAVENLRDRYDNIYTEELFSKMSHWVLQHYPNSPANMLRQLEGFKYELDELRAYTDMFSQVPDNAQALVALAKLEPQIVALIRAPPVSTQSQDATVRFEKRLSKLESIETTVSSLQKSMHALNPANLPFVREELLQQSMRTLQDGVDEVVRELRTGVKQTDDALKLETEKILQISGQLESLQQDAARLRHDTDKALEDVNDPATSHCIHRLPMLFTHAGQLQVAVETLSANLSRGPLQYKWDHDLKGMFPVSSPFLSEATGGS